MKRFIAFAVGMILSATSFAAITGTGGTEDFTGIAKDDATLLVFPTDLADWAEVRGSAIPVTVGMQIDNATNGTANAALYAVGSSGKTTDNAALRLIKTGGAANQEFKLSSPVITGGTATYTYYIANTGQPPSATAVTQLGRYIRTGVAFPDAGIEGLGLGFAICPSATPTTATGIDVQVYYGSFTTAQGYSVNGLSANVGASNADGNDLPFDTWGKCEIVLNLAAMTAACSFNGTLVETIDLTQAVTSYDTATPPNPVYTDVTLDDIYTHQFQVGAGAFARYTSAARNLFVDDVSISGVTNTRPAAPANLTAVAAEPGTVEVNLDWDDVTGVDGYNVYRSTTAGSGYTKVNTALLTESIYVDTDVTAYTTYYYVVRATAGGLESLDSTEANARPTMLNNAKNWVDFK